MGQLLELRHPEPERRADVCRPGRRAVPADSRALPFDLAEPLAPVLGGRGALRARLRGARSAAHGSVGGYSALGASGRAAVDVEKVRFSVLANSTVILTAVIYGFLLRIAVAAGLFGIALRVLVTFSLCRYAYAVLRHIASGWQNFPPPDIESMNPVGGIGAILHPALFSLALYFLGTTPFIEGPSRWVLLLVVLAIFPASMAIMAMTRNAAAALNPVALVSLVRDLGTDYVQLLGVSVLLGAFLVLTGIIAARSWFLALFGDMLAVWTVLALCLATGATLRARRAIFDLVEGLDDTDVRETKRRHADWQKTLDRAYGSVRSGLAAQAYRMIKDLIATEGESLEVY